MTYLVGTDIGTLGTKTVVVDAEGHIQGSSFLEYGVLTPKQGWAEQWPDVWENAAQASIKSAIEKAKIDPKEIAGAAISSLYGGSGIPLDGEMKPIRPCLIWADRRATEECRWLRDNIGAEALFKVTGNVIDPSLPIALAFRRLGGRHEQACELPSVGEACQRHGMAVEVAAGPRNPEAVQVALRPLQRV
ncbi:MAG: hypothetical protein HGA82_03735 [Anaerolineales bacterium]|nr:hypothetical protein [Anaerolineales bacterium]